MKTILVAEDNELNQEFLITVLQSHDFETVIANNGQEAIEQTRLRQPDLVLMDIQMPVMDGITALQELREDDLTKSIPVIAITGNATAYDLQQMQEKGFTNCIVKPFRIAELLSCIEAEISQSDGT